MIAGAFLLLGGFLTFIFTRLNDNRKAQRERDAVWTREVIDRGAKLLECGDKVRDLGLISLNRDISECLVLISEEGGSLLEELRLSARRFSLVMPDSFGPDFKDYMAWSTALLIPPFQQKGQLLALQHQAQASQRIINRIREVNGLPNQAMTSNGYQDLPERVEDVVASALDEIATANREERQQTDS
ncbi:hypothetical protein J4H92_10870 [Leucobacter weissii]|uniref:Uncharacterized protein n=1 Tax=Leucobacter weissii TaxID=1983706 RepID=A0A939MLH4_9MICO|nr:hypothetical protein [Leucobacter weissii]MBO1902450.1 hypothetical protein [Leucobacter weissii]